MANELEIFAQRLKSARVMAKLSMEGLCTLMGGLVTKQTISKYENAKMLPSSTILIALASALSVEMDYFFRPFSFDMQELEVSFRKKRSVSAKDEAALKMRIYEEIERYLEVEQILGIQRPFVPNVTTAPISTNQDMWMRAHEIRDNWKLGIVPIANVQSLLESHNIRVIILKDAPEGFDGLSGIINDMYPVIVLSDKLGIERQRFTALHELAHILYNKYMSESLTLHQKENLCHAFACEMLIDSSFINSVFGNNRNHVSLSELIPLQQDFGISIDAMVTKAFQLGLMSESRFRGYYIQKNTNKNFKALAEQSRYEEKPTNRFDSMVYSALARDLITESKAASLLNKSISDIRKHFNLV